MSNVNELRARWESKRDEEDTLRRTLTQMLPKPVEANGVRFHFFPAAVEVIGSNTSMNNDIARQVRDAFLAAYPIDPAPDSGWVSVGERLPEPDRDVLVYCSERMLVARWSNGLGWLMVWTNSNLNDSVTHWRELPAPPTT